MVPAASPAPPAPLHAGGERPGEPGPARCRPSQARRPRAAPGRPAAVVVQGRRGEVEGETGQFFTPNGREERSLLRFDL